MFSVSNAALELFLEETIRLAPVLAPWARAHGKIQANSTARLKGPGLGIIHT